MLENKPPLPSTMANARLLPDTPTIAFSDWSRLQGMESPATPEGSVPPSPMAGTTKRHKAYYFDNDDVIFLVEETLFKVHRSILMRHSSVFRDMFEMPQTAGETLEGSCDEVPIKLEDVNAKDFERLLGIIYPSTIGKYVATLPEWISILQLATRWLFDDIRALAIAELAELNIEPVQKVAIAIQCDIPEWLHSSYMALCDRPSPLTIEEARRLGLEVATQLACAREIYRDNRYRHKRDVDLSSIVSEVFGTVPPKRDDKPPELVLKYSQSWNALPTQPWNNLPSL